MCDVFHICSVAYNINVIVRALFSEYLGRCKKNSIVIISLSCFKLKAGVGGQSQSHHQQKNIPFVSVSCLLQVFSRDRAKYFVWIMDHFKKHVLIEMTNELHFFLYDRCLFCESEFDLW